MATSRIRIDVDWREVDRAVKRVIDALQSPSLTDSVAAGADVFVDGAQRRAPRESGALARSINKTPDGPAAFVIAPDTVYAGVQEFGATLRPKNSDAFPIPVAGSAGGVVFAEEVTVPASPYMGPTFVEDTPRAIQAVELAIQKKIS